MTPHDLHITSREDLSRTIVVPPYLRVAQDIIRLVDLCHLPLSFGPVCVRYTIGMVLQAQCAVRLFDIVCGRGTRDTKNFVETRLRLLIRDGVWIGVTRWAAGGIVSVGRGIVITG
jgi:hypothetical protein